MQFLLTLLHFSRYVMKMGSVFSYHTAQMPVADIPDRSRYRLHRDNAKQEVPGKKEFRQNKCILHTPDTKGQTEVRLPLPGVEPGQPRS